MKHSQTLQNCKIGLSKKAVMVSNFWLIGNIHHNFLVPRMIELVQQTLMHIQTLDLHSVQKLIVIFIKLPRTFDSFLSIYDIHAYIKSIK